MEPDKKKTRLLALGKGLLILAVVTALLWCFWHFAWGMILNMISFAFYVLIPALIITRLIFLFRSKRGVGAKVWRTAVYAAILFIALFVGMLGPNEIYRSTHRNAWETFVSTFPDTGKRRDALGSPELGAPEEMTYHHYYFRFMIFRWDADILLCRYRPENYAAQKAALEQQYTFRTEPLIGASELNGEDAVYLEPCVTIGNDEFCFIFPGDEDNAYGDRYFKRCLLLVTNDETHEIGFVTFIDDDLDEAKDLTRFLKEYCGWEYVR